MLSSASRGVHLRFKRGCPQRVGGCTNKPNLRAKPSGTRDERQLRKTKPISRLRIEDRLAAGRRLGPARLDPAKRTPRRDDYAKRSQTWAGWGIWGTVHRGAYRAKQSQLGNRRMNAKTLTRQRLRTFRLPSPPGRTKPIPGGRDTPTIPVFRYSSIPIRHRLCETNPISAGRPVKANGLCKTNPIGRAECAKQTQFFDCGLRIGHRAAAGRADCAKRTPRRDDYVKRSQTWALLGIWGTAREGSLLCETKPIF
jgi:hypothetical protein